MLKPHIEGFPVLWRLKILTALLLATTSELQAYTDPGSGALLLQVFSAAVVGTLFYWRRLTGWVRRRFAAKHDDKAGS